VIVLFAHRDAAPISCELRG